MAEEQYYLLTRILSTVNSIAGGTYWQTFGPGTVQVSNAVTEGVSVFDPGGGIIPQANITPGTYSIDRIRLGALTAGVSAGASSKTDGAVYKSYTFPAIDGWLIGDLFVVTFTGIQVVISGITTSFPPIQVWGRVVMEPDIDSIVNTINTNQGNPAADTLISTTAKLGNLARTLKLLLGARWDGTGDLGTDIAALLASGIAISGTVVDGAPTVIDFDTSLSEATNNHYNGGLLLFTNGPNAGQSHLVDVYTGGANGNVAFAINDRWTDVPVNGNSFILIPNAGAYLKKIFTAVSAIGGDPWTTLVPDAYGAGSAGKILGTNLDALISSRSASGEALAALLTDALDHLMSLADGASVFPASAVNNSVISKILAKGSPATTNTYDNTTDSLEALSDKVALEATLTAIKGAGWTIETLHAMYDLIVAIPTTAMRGTDSAMLAANGARIICSMDFWSIPQKTVAIPIAAQDQALPDVIVSGLPDGMTVVRAVGFFKFRSISNAGAANKLTNAQQIQVRTDAPGAWADIVDFVDDQFLVAAAAVDAPGDVVMGALNVSGTVTGNDTYNFQWDEAVADVAALTFNDVQMGLRIWYSV